MHFETFKDERNGAQKFILCLHKTDDTWKMNVYVVIPGFRTIAHGDVGHVELTDAVKQQHPNARMIMAGHIHCCSPES